MFSDDFFPEMWRVQFFRAVAGRLIALFLKAQELEASLPLLFSITTMIGRGLKTEIFAGSGV